MASSLPTSTTITPRSRMSRQQARAANRSAARLSGYLAAGLGATGLASVECEAAVVSVNVTNIGSTNQNISGINAGISSPSVSKQITNFPINGAVFNAVSEDYGSNLFRGFMSVSNMEFAAGNTDASPYRFSAAGQSSVQPSLPANTSWTDLAYRTAFIWASTATPNWPSQSYIGFRARPSSSSTDYTYGYFEVTWNNVSNEFQIFSGAYESTVNTPISVPEPSAVALTGIGALALGVGAVRRNRAVRKATASLGGAV